MASDYFPYACREDAVEEYKSLRTEIIESQKQRLTLLQYSLLFIVGLFGYLFKDALLDPSEALFLVVISTPCCFFSYSTRCRERRIAKYLAVFLPKLSPWSAISSRTPRLKFPHRTSTAIVLMMLLLNALVLFLSFPSGWRTLSSLPFTWIIAAMVAFINVAILWAVTHLPDFETPMRKELKTMALAAQQQQIAEHCSGADGQNASVLAAAHRGR